jgi:hypothetical protein
MIAEDQIEMTPSEKFTCNGTATSGGYGIAALCEEPREEMTDILIIIHN